MNISELIEFLEDYKREFGDLQVILAKDREGNDFSPLCDLGAHMYQSYNKWGGYIVDDEDADGYKLNALVMWPTD